MNNYCIHLKKKKGQPYCNLDKKEIPFSYCRECSKKEYKIKNKVKLKRETTRHKKADSTRFSLITIHNTCIKRCSPIYI